MILWRWLSEAAMANRFQRIQSGAGHAQFRRAPELLFGFKPFAPRGADLNGTKKIKPESI